MIALTRKCQYALRALYFLATEYGNGPILIPRISAHANTSADFLETILLQLKSAGRGRDHRDVHHLAANSIRLKLLWQGPRGGMLGRGKPELKQASRRCGLHLNVAAVHLNRPSGDR
jgi:hypothetical protein